jgi:hypothetical protein
MVYTDAILGATTGLLATAIVVNAASKMIKPMRVRARKHKGSNNLKHTKATW